MKVIRNVEWTFVGRQDGLLKFKSKRWDDYYILCNEAKYVDVSRNQVYVLNSDTQEEVEEFSSAQKKLSHNSNAR